MTWKTLTNKGYLLEKDDLVDGKGIRNSRQFLQQVNKEFIRLCVNFYDFTGELPFVHRERQVNSVLLPSIFKCADAAFVEQPITRNNNETSGHGWLDYWVLYGSTVFLIELKHAWVSAKSNKIRKITKEAWTKAYEQLRSISSEEASVLSYQSKTLVKMALMVVPFYQASKNRNNFESYGKDCVEEILPRLVNGLTPTPDWSSAWLLHERLQRPVAYSDERYELYPCVGLIALVDNSLL